MADPVIVPPVPTVKQGEPIEAHPDDSIARSIQEAFDRVMPPSKSESPPPDHSQAPPAQPPVQEPTPVPESPPPPPTPAPEPAAEHKIPSFIEEALKVEPISAKTAPEAPKSAPEEGIPEELPSFKTPEESKANWRQFRERYNALKAEADSLRSRPGGPDPATSERLGFLETQNKEMREALNRVSVETHQDFQQNVLRPMHGAWNEACRIVQEGGGDPAQLSRALSLAGKDQYEALDEIFAEIPESARTEAQTAIRAFKHYAGQRQAALANAPQTAQALRKADLQRQYATLEKQREEMRSFFDDAVRILRDEAKVEVLQTSNDPDAKWWNDQARDIEDGGRKLYLENSDLRKMAMACLLAPAADGYRKMWLSERAARLKAEDTIKERFGAEPSLSESSGASRTPDSVRADDLARPFHEVFLEKFHQLRQQGR
jgi:hypothetical protein